MQFHQFISVFRVLTSLGLVLFASVVAAQVTISDPWVRATVPSQRAAGVFMEIKADASARIVGGSTTAAAKVEIHEMTHDNGVMRMRAIPGIEVSAGQTLSLKPGGYHFMLIDLTQPIKAGDAVPITLVVEGLDRKQTKVEVVAKARAMGAAAAHDSQHKH
jgi:periplasmic copper chaperone A